MNNLIALCHGAACAAGWWTDLSTGESLRGRLDLAAPKIALIHSELSEALEGDRKNLMDDKLPHRPMREVELADAVIRAADLCGALNWFDLDMPERFNESADGCEKLASSSEFQSFGHNIAALHMVVSSAYTRMQIDESGGLHPYNVRFAKKGFADFFRAVRAAAVVFDLDIDGAISEKMAYNATRADHKPENRRLEGGKTY